MNHEFENRLRIEQNHLQSLLAVEQATLKAQQGFSLNTTMQVASTITEARIKEIEKRISILRKYLL